jgi:hypothetical protein
VTAGPRRLLVPAGIFAVTALSRLPFATTHLWAWDSTLYARALEHGFYVTADMATQRPHPPGYIWYVGTAALARLVLRDSNAALVAVSILASALASALLYVVARRYVPSSVALIAALAFAASPLVWTYSEVAYPYTLLALLSLVLGAWMLDGRRPVLMSLALGVLTGFRQDLLLVLGALWLWRILPLGPRAAAAAAGALAAGALMWAVPSALLSGGPAAYLGALSDQSSKVTGGSAAPPGMSQLTFNFAVAGEGLLWGLGPLWLVLIADAAWGATRAARGHARIRPTPLAVATLLWTLPALAFYLFVHLGEWGYVLGVVPPLTLAAAIRADRALARTPSRLWPAAAALAVAIPALVFLTTDIKFSAARIRAQDRAPTTYCVTWVAACSDIAISPRP